VLQFSPFLTTYTAYTQTSLLLRGRHKAGLNNGKHTHTCKRTHMQIQIKQSSSCYWNFRNRIQINEFLNLLVFAKFTWLAGPGRFLG